jgi:hypothetical protein
MRLDRSTLPTVDGGDLTVSVEVTNTGERAGDEVVQLYARDEEATVARPVLELRGFCRVALAAGERRTVTFRLACGAVRLCRGRLSARDRARHRPAVVGTSSCDLPLEATVELVGLTVELVERQRVPDRDCGWLTLARPRSDQPLATVDERVRIVRRAHGPGDHGGSHEPVIRE